MRWLDYRLPANSSAAGNESKQISEYASNNSSTNNKRGGMKSRNGRNMKKNVINDDTQGIELVVRTNTYW